MIRWPFTNLHELNLDWLISQMKDLVDKVASYATSVTASATTGPAGSSASVTVTGDLDNGMNLAFTIPRGDTGSQGPEGPEGPEGPPGQDGAVAIHYTNQLNLDLQSTLSIASGSSDTVYTQIQGITPENISKVMGIHEWTKTNAASQLLVTETEFLVYDSHACFRMKLYNPTDSAISLMPASIKVSFVYYS